MPLIQTPNDGGSQVTSYALYWNQGSGTVFTPFMGVASDNLNRFGV